jgi:electron transport complex protein RnfB
MDKYEKLREILDASPTGAPKSRAFDEILRILYSPDEADLAACMTLFPRPLEAIAADAGVDPDRAGRMLEAMADRAVVMSREKDGKRSYGLLPTIPGLFEFPFMRGALTPELARLAKLWDEYHRETQGAAFSGNPTPIARVIPVEQSVGTATHIHPHDEVARLIDTVDYVALGNCACRVSVDACDKPREMCLIFDAAGRFLVSRGFARQISRKEAHAVLDKAEETGLVHTSNNSADKASFICNCCSCCCTILTCRTRLGLPHAFAESAFQAHIDAGSCTGCSICADDRCPMGAIDASGDTAVLTPERCIGCGLCVSTCPTGSIGLVRRESPPEVLPTMREMGARVLSEKGKLEAFLSQMKG